MSNRREQTFDEWWDLINRWKKKKPTPEQKAAWRELYKIRYLKSGDEFKINKPNIEIIWEPKNE